jgi:hypothetical protein
MRRLTVLLIVLLSPSLPASEEVDPVGLSELAGRSDFVALAQVRDTDYRLRRDIPVSGSAYLRPLITYKGDGDVEVFEVYEMGLREHACYFPNPDVFEEGRRYLVFLVRDEQETDRYRGHPQGCALAVLVDADNRYALRFPADGIALVDDLDALAQPMRFADRYAVIADGDLVPMRRDKLLQQNAIEARGPRAWRYTRGIPLTEARRLIEPRVLED